MTEEKITYLLGAGASANAVPTVAQFIDRIRAFTHYLGKIAQQNAHVDRATAQFFYSQYKWLIEGIEAHTSPDYFAQFLGQSSEESKNRAELTRLKLLLSLFFIFEQSDRIMGGNYTNHDSYNYVGQPQSAVLSKEIQRAIDTKIDPRYRVFWQNIFSNPSQQSVPSNINIVSWNYDIQLELSKAEFAKRSLEIINRDLQVVPNGNMTEVDFSKFTVVKLNGTAGLFYKESDKKIIEDDSYFNGTNINWFKNIELYKQLILGQSTLIEFPHFHFSWEKNSHTDFARAAAQKILANTETLITIGYSFPKYNNSIDRDILKRGTKLKRIIIQVMDDKKRIEKEVKAYLPEEIRSEVEIEFDDNLNQFHTI